MYYFNFLNQLHTTEQLEPKMALHQSNFLRGIDKKTEEELEEREFHVVYLCSLLSNTHFIRKQNGSKLQSFLYIIFSKKYFLNGNHTWQTLFVKGGCCFNQE